MVVDGERFYLYNGDFLDIAISEGIGRNYDQFDDMFMGSNIDDLDFIVNYLK